MIGKKVVQERHWLKNHTMLLLLGREVVQRKYDDARMLNRLIGSTTENSTEI